jgi:hypothetical protein
LLPRLLLNVVDTHVRFDAMGYDPGGHAYGA